MSKKQWLNPELKNLNLEATHTGSGIEYLDWCDWTGGAEILGMGNEDYTDPNNKPAQHPDWVWCTQHNRWHPKNHGNEGGENFGS